MKLRHAVMVSLLGRAADRFHEYHPARALAERLELARGIEGCEGIEVIYPQDLGSNGENARLVRESGLPVAAVNLNVKGHKQWQGGSFTAADPALRAAAVADLKAALDLAADLGAGMVTCCPLIDGHNYAFEVDYLQQWRWLEEGIAAGLRHRPDVRLSLEYKLNESRNYCILPDIGRTLYLCERVGLPNVGVTLDVGHALVAKETPAEALALAGQAGRLFYVHFNDNAREWDWDMLPGSVNLWDMLEMLFYMERMGWEGWLSYDIVTRNGDQAEALAATISIVESARRLLDKLGRERLEGYIKEGIPARAFRDLIGALV
ncbi:MAG: sugar phosphate isomerase/epimerase family protein [Chloroflexota bacterium]